MSDVTRYTREDVKQRDGKKETSVWMIYKNGVYDVTAYISEHPGGDEILQEAGCDSTSTFDSIHSSDARVIMEKYKIGELVEEEKKYDANGKKIKVVTAEGEGSNRSCLNICTCGLLG